MAIGATVMVMVVAGALAAGRVSGALRYVDAAAEAVAESHAVTAVHEST